ncbi:MAG: hypothetical protein ACT4ON_13520 [Bacteroidota bacterium]
MILKTRYKIIEVSVNPLEIKKFEFKIPEDFIMVNGFLVTTQGEGAGANNLTVGRLSLSLNNKMSNPVLQYVQTDKVQFKRRKYEFQKLAEPLIGGTYIQGFYENLNASDNTYTVKIYLKGKKLYR